MKQVRCCAIIFLSVIFAVGASSLFTGVLFASDFFDESGTNPEKLSPKKLFPDGRLFLYAGYSGNPERDLANGFSVAGPFYGNQDALLEECHRRGFPTIAHIGFRDSGFANSVEAIEAAAKLTSDEIEQMVRSQMRVFETSGKSVVLWALTPEEVRPWRAAEVKYCLALHNMVHNYDPQTRPTYMYHPNNRATKDLMTVAPGCDYLGKGSYVNISGYQNDRAWVRWNVEQCLAAREKTMHDHGVVIVQPWMARDPEKPAEDSLIPTWARHDVYLGLVSGAKGVLIWSLAPRKGFERTWQTYYDAYAACGAELTGKQKLGDVFLFGEKREDLKVEPLAPRAPYKHSRDEGKTSQQFYAWSSAEYAYGKSRYIFVVNSWREETPFRVSGFPANAKAASAWNDETMTLENNSLTFTLPAWGVLALRVTAE